MQGGIRYSTNSRITVDQFIDLLRQSSLGDRRPIDDLGRMTGILLNTNLLVTAWHGRLLVGLARSITDFYFSCYISDLAVRSEYQNIGIGKSLIRLVQRSLSPECKLILIAAPSANSYYKHLGFEQNSRCWTLNRKI
ncbi:GNAT family N-acetyltransferase [Acidithiobacillus caldus ATCC 51756]|nr:GNAT family N-acetyltransferase [Acidithiobacillus caldus]MBU2735971.1 GNAT family N-acetyltransferase [Acidithiobacillus caldus ATCC 51756]MBU2744217.1 GNAT family N-acetyltransferase [Acidithiobacillus caldus]MBU2779646.1 GNAT family N-acetyltransferase [Acidithiobacillus caldus]